MKRDVLPRLDGLSKRAGLNRRDGFDNPESLPAPEMVVQRDVEAHDEPTWEVRRPTTGRSGIRRIDGRTRSILTMAAVAAIMVNAGAAWAYWKVTKSETASGRAGMAVELTLRGRSNLSKPLTPGGNGDLTVTLTNDNDFPIHITSVRPGPGHVVADDEHRDAGCRQTGVSMTRHEFAVSWKVAKNTIGAFTLPKGLQMAEGTDDACAGATFTVPVRTTGVSGS